MVDAHDLSPGRAPYDARQEGAQLTYARDRFAVNISQVSMAD